MGKRVISQNMLRAEMEILQWIEDVFLIFIVSGFCLLIAGLASVGLSNNPVLGKYATTLPSPTFFALGFLSFVITTLMFFFSTAFFAYWVEKARPFCKWLQEPEEAQE